MTRPLPHPRPAAQDHVRLQGDVGGQLHLGVDERGGRVEHRDAGPHPGRVDPLAHGRRGLGQLGSVVDPVERPVVGRLEGDHQPARPRPRDRRAGSGRARRSTGEGVRRAIAAAQPGRVEGVEAGVDLADCKLVRRARPSPPRCGRPARRRRCGPRGPGGPAPRPRRRRGRPPRRHRRRRSRSPAMRSASTRGTSPESTTTSSASAGSGGQTSPQRVAGAVRPLLEGEGDAGRERVPHGGRGGRIDHDAGPPGRRRAPRPARRRASGGRRPDGAPSAGATSCACRARRRAPRRRDGSSGRGAGGATRERGGLRVRATAGRRGWIGCHLVRGS